MISTTVLNKFFNLSLSCLSYTKISTKDSRVKNFKFFLLFISVSKVKNYMIMEKNYQKKVFLKSSFFKAIKIL